MKNVKKSTPLLALTATGLVAACLGGSLPAAAATAIPVAPVESARPSDSSTSERVDIERTRAGVLLVVHAIDGTVIAVRDTNGHPVAGGVARNGSTRILIPAPRTASDYVVEEGPEGATAAIGRVTLDGTASGSLDRPVIDESVAEGSRAMVTVSGEPGAVVTITDDDTVVGVKTIGSAGRAKVAMPTSDSATDSDRKLKASQRIDGDVSPTAEFDIAAPAKVDVGHIATDAAVVAFTGATNTHWPLAVFDEDGKQVAGGSFASLGPTTRTLRLRPGVVNHFTVRRGDEGHPWSSRVAFEVDARKTGVMTEPAVRFVAGTMTRLSGTPGALVRIDAPDMLPVVDTLSPEGAWGDIRRRLQPGKTYTARVSVGSDLRDITFTVPTA